MEVLGDSAAASRFGVSGPHFWAWQEEAPRDDPESLGSVACVLARCKSSDSIRCSVGER